MKITNELKEKIYRSVNKKHQPARDSLNKDLDAAQHARNKRLTKELTEVLKKYPDLKPLILRGYRNDSPEQFVTNNANYHVAIDKDIQKIRKSLNKLSDTAADEIENLTIAISYGKTMDDIKEAFKAAGLTF